MATNVSLLSHSASTKLSSLCDEQKVQDWDFEKFPIDLKKYKPIPLDPVKDKELSTEQKETLVRELNSLHRLCAAKCVRLPRQPTSPCSVTSSPSSPRPVPLEESLVIPGTRWIILLMFARMTIAPSGAFDTVPEVVILLCFIAGDKSGSKFVDILFDEAGHRVATQYLLSVLDGHLPVEHLLHYREANSRLPGHPELGLTPGVKFSSGRLGHMWPLVNGVAMGNPSKAVFCLGSDGSQQEGDDAEAARLAAAKNLNVKVFVDDNDVTIAQVYVSLIALR